MGLDDIVNKGKELFGQNQDKIDEAIHSEQAEGISDAALDKGSDFAKGVAPDGADAQIDDVRTNLDGRVGNE